MHVMLLLELLFQLTTHKQIPCEGIKIFLFHAWIVFILDVKSFPWKWAQRMIRRTPEQVAVYFDSRVLLFQYTRFTEVQRRSDKGERPALVRSGEITRVLSSDHWTAAGTGATQRRGWAYNQSGLLCHGGHEEGTLPSRMMFCPSPVSLSCFCLIFTPLPKRSIHCSACFSGLFSQEQFYLSPSSQHSLRSH